jgi:hypothetical protein
VVAKIGHLSQRFDYLSGGSLSTLYELFENKHGSAKAAHTSRRGMTEASSAQAEIAQSNHSTP